MTFAKFGVLRYALAASYPAAADAPGARKLAAKPKVGNLNLKHYLSESLREVFDREAAQNKIGSNYAACEVRVENHGTRKQFSALSGSQDTLFASFILFLYKILSWNRGF
ncbi:MAG: hypothetical protein NZM04_00765 [Methylacidiphilales bacterium]|nr:hypothetical protein [Candidatus Methylacidiphilales bacterium]